MHHGQYVAVIRLTSCFLPCSAEVSRHPAGWPFRPRTQPCRGHSDDIQPGSAQNDDSERHEIFDSSDLGKSLEGELCGAGSVLLLLLHICQGTALCETLSITGRLLCLSCSSVVKIFCRGACLVHRNPSHISAVYPEPLGALLTVLTVTAAA